MTPAEDAPTVWRCGRFTLSCDHPLVMGVLNVTPDSFSDGGTHNTYEAAVAWGQQLARQGADVIDVGGESTRPGSDEVSPEEELARVLPVVKALAERGLVVSVDTRHWQVARAVVEAGAAIINDVSGFRDPRMVEVAAGCDAGLVVMHMLGEPKTMQREPHYDNVAAEVGAYLRRQAKMLEEAGVSHDRICIDPGPGFGKTAAHNIELLRATPYLASLGYPLMVATSRKRFIGTVTGVEVAADRVAASLATALYAIEHGAVIARVHDVEHTAQAFAMLHALMTYRRDNPAAPEAPAPLGTAAGRGSARRIYLALGSNEGDRAGQLQQAVDAIDALPQVTVTAVSQIYGSEPAYYGDQPVFANAVIAVATDEDPEDLLAQLQQIELDLGRRRDFPNAPRTLDLDIIDVSGVTSADPLLTLPHPKALERDFVVTPLLECARHLGDAAPVLADGTPVTADAVSVGKVTQTLGDLVIKAR